MNYERGTYRLLTEDEKLQYTTKYKYVILTPYRYEFENRVVLVPRGFLTDGSTESPDYGSSWIVHDFIYATHKFLDGTSCTEKEANEIMIQINQQSNPSTWYGSLYMSMYSAMASIVFYVNPFYLVSNAWDQSGSRGPEYLSLD
jgi:hypothetical protein